MRFFGLARPLARYLERLASHDLALRVLGRVRVRVYERIEPLAPAQLEGYRHGDLLARMVADVDALQNLHLRGVGPPLVALLAGAVAVGVAAAFLPAAGLVLAAGLLVGGVAVPALAGWLGRRGGRRQAAARGELTAELVEVLRAAPELVAYGGAGDALARAARGRRRARPARAPRRARRRARATALGLAVAGATVAGVLAVAVRAPADGHLDRVLIAMLALLALASFEAVQPLAAAARELSATLAAGRRVLELTDREAAVVDPAAPLPAPRGRSRSRSRTCARATRPASARRSTASACASSRAAASRSSGPSGAGKTTVANLLLRFLDPEAGRVTLGGRDLREYRQEDVRRAIAVAGQDAHLFSASIRENVRLARPDASDEDVERGAAARAALDWVATLPDGLDTLVGEEGRELSGGQRQRLVARPRAARRRARARARRADRAPRPGHRPRADRRRPRRRGRPLGAADHPPPRGARPRRRDHPHRVMPAAPGQGEHGCRQLTQRKGAAMAIGPVQLIVLGFSHPEFHGEIIAELERLRESDTVRVIDALAVHKDADGEIEVAHLSNLTKDEAIELGSKVGALIGLGIEGEEGMVAGAEAGAEAGADGISVFSDEEAWDVLEDIPNDSAAALILLEHHWAVPLRDAVARAGGFRLSDGFISPLDLVEIGLVSSEEAAELHAIETSRQPA